jgi:hypothetical protein
VILKPPRAKQRDRVVLTEEFHSMEMAEGEIPLITRHPIHTNPTISNQGVATITTITRTRSQYHLQDGNHLLQELVVSLEDLLRRQLVTMDLMIVTLDRLDMPKVSLMATVVEAATGIITAVEGVILTEGTVVALGEEMATLTDVDRCLNNSGH